MKRFLIYFLIVGGLLFQCTTAAPAESKTVFAPRISDFAVTFSDKPVIIEFESTTTDGVPLKGMRAEVFVQAAACFQRVEVTPMPAGFAENQTKESAMAKMREYAIHNGFVAPEFTWEITSIGKRAAMRATKVFDDHGKPRAATFQSICYYGRSSLFMVYVGAPSESYPPTRIVEFLESVRKNEKK